MIVTCTTNQEDDLRSDLHQYAMTQSEGVLDISPGKSYAVYAMMTDERGRWYLVHTDELNQHSLWWMPADAYDVVDPDQPKGWVSYTADNSTIIAYSVLFEPGIEEGILDGEDRAVDAYMQAVATDKTFPPLEQVRAYNQAYEQRKREQRYTNDLKMARERGYEYPEKTEL